MGRGIEMILATPADRSQNSGLVGRRLIGELGPYRRELLTLVGYIVIGALAQAGGPWIISQAIDQDILRPNPGGLALRMAALFAVYLIGTWASRGQISRVGSIGQKVLANLRARLFDQFQHLPLGYFDRHPIGDLMSRVINDVDTINGFLGQGLTQLVGSLFSLVGIVIAMLFLNLTLALVCFLVIPAILLTTSFFSDRARSAFRRTRETVGNVTADIQEEIVGVREAQAFNRTDSNIARFRTRNRANRDANVSAVAITSAFSPAIDVLSTLATALVIGFGGYLVFQGSLTVGLLAAFLIYVQQFFRPVQLVSQVYTQLQASLAGGERIYSILDEPQEPVDPPGTPDLPTIAGGIEFDGVTFAYDAGRDVLRDVTFRSEPGQTVALVGPTGAGKTTTANLIPRFYDVSIGTVRVDGQDVREVTRASLRRGIAMVLQEPFLFNGTVAENIGYGRLDASRDEIESAARTIGAHEFITVLENGYDTRVGEGGGSLSQGQRQLLAFARAVLADPRILILDEATSNIDTRTEAAIQRALAKLLAGRTSVVIAHRLSTIQKADQILVLQEGRIVERGAHAALIANDGLYAELYRRQFRDVSTGQEVTTTNGLAVPSHQVVYQARAERNPNGG